MRKHIGTGLIVASLALLIYIYFPILLLYLPYPPKKMIEMPQGFFIEIPKIQAQAPIIEQVDAVDKDAYLPALQKGVAQAKGSVLPGEKGTDYLFAHSSLPPWEMTRLNTSFLRLPELTPGDQIFLFKDGKKYLYIVTEKKEVWPNQSQDLQNFKKNQLVLQTCVPIGTDLKRLLVFATPN